MNQVTNSMDLIISLAKRRGFVFPGSDIYGGLANTWDYGPLGAQLKKNIKTHWWNTFVESRDDMVGLDGAILMNSKVWEASGHVDGFTDPLVEDLKTNKRYRADHLIEAATDIDADGMSLAELKQIIEENKIKSPDGNPLSEPKTFNLMFETAIGTIEGEKNSIYLRPETAQAIFTNFKNVIDTTRKRLPFGIAQIGKAFRNEITPGNFIFRTIEFEQMEIEYFLEEKDWKKAFEAWLTAMEDWAKEIGIDPKRTHRREHEAEKLSHYSKRTVDVEFEYPFGQGELWGLAYRTDYDLNQHQEHSKVKLEYTDPADNTRKLIPHVVEPSFGVDRTLLAVLLSAYHEEKVNNETRVVMKFTPEMAPYQVAILPLSKKPELSKVAKKIHKDLLKQFRTEYDETASIGKRYRRQDEIGTPWCVTVDFESLEDKMVTIRDRDTLKQERIAIKDLDMYITNQIK